MTFTASRLLIDLLILCMKLICHYGRTPIQDMHGMTIQVVMQRGLGYCYNGKAVDGTGQIEAYGDQPPAIGIDFFQGPYMDPDGIDNPKYNIYTDADGNTIYEQICDESINGVNFGDGIVDNERFGMRRFVYHNNTGVPNYMTDPDIAIEYYNF